MSPFVIFNIPQHAKQTSTGLKTLEFQVDKPFQPLAQYEFLLGDQVILAPMVGDDE